MTKIKLFRTKGAFNLMKKDTFPCHFPYVYRYPNSQGIEVLNLPEMNVFGGKHSNLSPLAPTPKIAHHISIS